MADLELNSIGNGDGNNYLLRDNSKIPLSGSNQISGNLIPTTDNSIDVGSSSKKYLNVWSNNFKGSYIEISGNTAYPSIKFKGGQSSDVTSNIIDGSTSGIGSLYLDAFNINDNTYKRLNINVNGTLSWSGSSFLFTETTSIVDIKRTVNNNRLLIYGGTDWDNSGVIGVGGKNELNYGGAVFFRALSSGNQEATMFLYGNGTWTWGGSACQITSDQRLKQQISEIDDDLLTAWEDVELSQFKYNDAVEEKGNTARLHTGYVVQQIDDACKKHNVDVSKYGLYCHEEYEEETREVEHEDGTKTTEVVRPANEHYSLRYTECYAVECAYLRMKNKELQAQLDNLFNMVGKLTEKVGKLEGKLQ